MIRRLMVTALIAPLVVLPTAAPAAAACGKVPGDYNGDGYGDLAVNSTFLADPATGSKLGALDVAYGSAAGLGKGAPSITLRGSSDGMPDAVRTAFSFGDQLAYGYFDGDCYADLAVGVWSVSSTLVLYGSSTGLTTARSQVFDRQDIQPGGADESALGMAIASGDFNGDGYSDIAAGASWASRTAGAVGVLYGSAAGITAAGAQWIDQDSPYVPGASEPNDMFGDSLAAGDFNGDGRSDLAVGVPDESIGKTVDAGGVVVLSGTPSGLTGKNSLWFDQSQASVPGTAEYGDIFGAALVAGDTNGDGRAELVVASPGEKIGTKAKAGMVTLFRGSTRGLLAGPGFDQDNSSIPGASEAYDWFGEDLALVDLNRDGKRDLVVGVPGEAVGTATYTGAINVLFSGASGPAVKGSLFIDQNSAGVPGANEYGDDFGRSLSQLSNAYGGDALVVAAPGESVTYGSEGAVTVLPSAKGTARPAGYFFTGANFPGGAAASANFGTGMP